MTEKNEDAARMDSLKVTSDAIATASEDRETPASVTPTINFGALSKQQRDVIDQIGCNNDLGHHPRTLESLERMGLIESYEETLPDRRFPLRVKRYMMPLWVHIQWCEWCSRELTHGA